MDVSIIIVAWNVKDLLRDCLKSVFEQTHGIEFEIIYVDNASQDGSVEMAAKEFPSVKIMQNSENRGFIKANNQAIEAAKGRYVLLLNSDTVVLDNAIAKTVKFADAHPDAAVAGCKILNPDKTLQRKCFMYPSVLNMLLSATYLYKIFPRSKFFGREEMTWWDYNDVREVETICGCFSLVRNEAIGQVGLMDERYFVYGDDPDWCYRFSKKGWKILYTPNAQIIHYGGQTTNQKARTFRLQLEGSKLIFMKLHRSKAEFPAACFLTALFFLIRAPYWFAVGLFEGEKRGKAFEQTITYLIGAYYCLANWRKLLMNMESLKGKL
jgi:GT2 family glycosyltransferase